MTDGPGAIYRGFQLDPFQQSAIALLSKRESVLVSAPTGTGKTLIADYLVDRALEEGVELIYTAPIKALVNEKFFAACRDFGPENVGLMTGDASVNRDASIICCTVTLSSGR